MIGSCYDAEPAVVVLPDGDAHVGAFQVLASALGYVDDGLVDVLEELLLDPRLVVAGHEAVVLVVVDEKKRRLEESGELTRMKEEEIARSLGALLSYSEETIDGLLEKPRF